MAGASKGLGKATGSVARIPDAGSGWYALDSVQELLVDSAVQGLPEERVTEAWSCRWSNDAHLDSVGRLSTALIKPLEPSMRGILNQKTHSITDRAVLWAFRIKLLCIDMQHSRSLY